MPEKIVYILGAGFSAPLGLPVMSNFLERSKDIFAADSKKHSSFSDVFGEINRMAQAKNYLNLDLFNIEQILSILEMEDHTAGTSHRDRFTRYLAETVRALTPDFRSDRKLSAAWEDSLFAADRRPRSYCQWVAGLFGVSIRETDVTGELAKADEPEPDADYGIVSLNYDMVLEQCLDAINQQVVPHGKLVFRRTIEGVGLPLAKIHGSVEPLTIVPPTWQKAARPEVQDAWALAAQLLTEANRIRILGFSFPESDGYLRYLLSLGAMRAPHLKEIDVVCLDPDRTVEARYRDFVSFKKFRFISQDLAFYFGNYGEREDEKVKRKWHGRRCVEFRGISGHHERQMASAGRPSALFQD